MEPLLPKLKWRKINVLDAAILLYHVARGESLPEVGFEDADRTLDVVVKRMNKGFVWMDQPFLESTLWSANLMDERGEFFHPQGKTFEEWVKRIIHKDDFHRFYNFIKSKDGND